MAAPGKRYSNYAGWLVKIGDYTIPSNRFIRADSYKAQAIMQDVDPWTDANGYVHRNAVKLKALKVEFETPAMLTDDDVAEFLYHISENIITNGKPQISPDGSFYEEGGNECYITAFVQRYNKYFTQKGYLADIEPQIYGNYEKIRNEAGQEINGILRCDPIRFAFVGGVYDG